MTDPLKRVLPGESLAGYPAEAMNYMMDAAKRVNTGQAGVSGDSIAGSDKSIINVKNNTGGDLEAYSVIGLTRGVVFDEDDNLKSYKRDPVIIGNTPSEEGRFAITLQPIPDGRRGRAMVLGVSYCKVDVTDEDHEFADIADGETGYLQSAETGTARILRKPEGTGELDCVVMLTGAASTESNGNGEPSDNCGPCTFQSVGAVTCFDQLNSMPGGFQIQAPGSFLDGVVMLFDTSCEYISDTFEVGCDEE